MTNLEKLSLEHGFNTVEEFFNYTIESYINGNKKQFTELMTQCVDETAFNKQEFQSCILTACNTFGLKETISILKKFKTFEYRISDSTIINAFYDNSNYQLSELKAVL